LPQGIRALDADAGECHPEAAEERKAAGALELAILEELQRRAFCSDAWKAPPVAVAPPPGLAVMRPPPGLAPPAKFEESMSDFRTRPPRSCGTSDTGSTADATEEPPSPLIAVAVAAPGLEDLPPLPMMAIPSVGSAGHHLGLCKPCDFVDRGFCRAGADCRFCHLCGPAERRQRKLQRRKLVRAAKRAEGSD